MAAPCHFKRAEQTGVGAVESEGSSRGKKVLTALCRRRPARCTCSSVKMLTRRPQNGGTHGYSTCLLQCSQCKAAAAACSVRFKLVAS
jgi:hypothetical protein